MAQPAASVARVAARTSRIGNRFMEASALSDYWGAAAGAAALVGAS